MKSRDELKFARENKVASDTVVIPYKVINIRFITLYGIITVSMFAYFLRAFYSYFSNMCICIQIEFCRVITRIISITLGMYGFMRMHFV